MSDHIVIDPVQLEIARRKNAGDVADIAGTDVYGLKNCRTSWGAVIAKSLIFNVLDCTGGETLNQVEVDCLMGKLSENLAVNCC